MSERRHIYGMLTQEEWHTCFAFVFVDDTREYKGHYPLRQHATEGAEETYEEGFRRVVRWLALEHGVEWTGMAVREDGHILATQEDYVEEANLTYCEIFALGTMPSPLRALERAQGWARKHAPNLDIEPLRAAHADVEAQRDRFCERVGPEYARMQVEARREALAALTKPDHRYVN